MSKVPEIRINLANLLLYMESQILAEDNELDTYEHYEEQTRRYRKEWSKHEKKIISALQDCLGVEFHKPVIDVSCAPFFVPKSDPLIMNFANDEDQFVDVLTHELCHVLLTDNNRVQLNNPNNKVDLIDIWQKLFGKHDFVTMVHIPVHALSKYIYLDILKQPYRHERDIKSVEGFEGNSKEYLGSWDYVDKHDYKKIVANLKQSYQEMAT